MVQHHTLPASQAETGPTIDSSSPVSQSGTTADLLSWSRTSRRKARTLVGLVRDR